MSKEDAVEEVKVVDGKVLAFAIGVVALLAVVVCAVLTVGLYLASQRYLEQSEVTIKQSGTLQTMQRSLDRADGKLQVYETYLVNRNIDIVRSLIARFLKESRKTSAKAVVKDFEGWLGTGCSACPSHEGMGGGGR